MKNRAFWLILGTLICFGFAWHDFPAYADRLGKIQTDYQAKKIDHATRSQMVVTAMVENTGATWKWHLGGFLLLCGAMHYGHTQVRSWLAKLGFALPTVAVFLLATAFFLVADESAKFLPERCRAELFEELIKIKLGSIVVSLFAGRMCFEMFKPVFSSDAR
ncbi:MAG: hypothetical protein KF715_19945 [Candidatus Didemnitutus sp.]|nr:hypothetical protein [Candidatus Didemnitutus sp.]